MRDRRFAVKSGGGGDVHQVCWRGDVVGVITEVKRCSDACGEYTVYRVRVGLAGRVREHGTFEGARHAAWRTLVRAEHQRAHPKHLPVRYWKHRGQWWRVDNPEQVKRGDLCRGFPACPVLLVWRSGRESATGAARARRWVDSLWRLPNGQWCRLRVGGTDTRGGWRRTATMLTLHEAKAYTWSVWSDDTIRGRVTACGWEERRKREWECAHGPRGDRDASPPSEAPRPRVDAEYVDRSTVPGRMMDQGGRTPNHECGVPPGSPAGRGAHPTTNHHSHHQGGRS